MHCPSDPQYKNYTFDQHVKDFYNYYITTSPTKTNQKIIKEILTLSNKNNLTWVYTDYLKNQYAIEKRSSIFSNCIVFLILQIFLLKPKVVITFGGNVLKLFLNLFIDMICKSITISGKVSEDHGKSYKKCIDFNKIYRGSFNSSSINLFNIYKQKFNLPDVHRFFWIISMFPGGNNRRFTKDKKDTLLEKIAQCLKLEEKRTN